MLLIFQYKTGVGTLPEGILAGSTITLTDTTEIGAPAEIRIFQGEMPPAITDPTAPGTPA